MIDDLIRACRLDVLFALEVGNRHLHVLGVTGHLDGPWTTRQARNLIIDLGDRVTRIGGLINEYESAA